MISRIIKIFTTIVAVVFALTMVAMAIVVNFIFTPEKITPLVTQTAQEFVRSELSVGEIELTFFSSFPHFSIEIDSLVIKQENPLIDDLLNARRCRVAVNPLALLKKEIIIDEITIEKTSINLYVDSITRPINLFKFEADSTQTAQNDTMSLNGYKFRLDRVKIDSSTIVIDDRERDFYSKIGGFSVDMGLSIAPDTCEMETKIALEEFSIRMKEKVFASNMSLGMRSQMKYYRDSTLLTLDRTSLNVNDIEMRVNGSLRGDKEDKSVYVDLRSMMSTPSITEFLNLVPTYIFDEKEAVTTSGSVDMRLDINGVYSKTHYPELNAKLKITDGKAKYDSRKLSIEEIDCDADMLIDLNTPSRSYTTINNLYINTSDILNLTVDGKITDMINSPYIDINIDSEIDLDRLVEIFPLQDGVSLSGYNTSDLHTRFSVKDIEQSNYGNLYIDGVSTFRDVAIDIDGALYTQDTTSTGYLHVDISEGTLLFGDKVRENNSRTLLATMDVSGFSFMDKMGQYTSIKNLKLTSGANFDTKTKKVNGVGIRAEAQNTVIGIEDQVEMNLGSTDATLTISPKNEERNTKIHAIINSQSIEASESIYNSTVNLSNVDMDLNMLRAKRKKWETDGEIGFQRLKMYSDLFPLDMAIPRSSVSVVNNKITLKNTRLKLGESTILATGHITNMIRVFFLNSEAQMEGELNIQSPLLDVNELMVATNKSILLSEEMDQIQQDSTYIADVATPTDSLGMMLLVPKNINFNFDLNIDKVKFNDTFIENIIGKAQINEGVLSLDRLTLKAIGGRAYSSLRYENLDENSSNLLFNMRMGGVQINRIEELMPDVATFMPIINSIDGKVNLELKVVTNIDRDLSVDIETLRAASSLMGRDIELKESEEFTALADALMFKNKDHSLIDSLRIYITADKSKIDVLPFEITIDRYKAIIGGEQTIDLDNLSVEYDYNISVIKSPLPFKAGVDVFGINEDFDFKITKAKLKNSDFGALQQEYDEFRESIK
ncbi:MAG: AsmA family protein [Rikenellaceae bacterium]